MRHAVRHYLKSGGGSLITISSWAAQRGPGNPALLAYAASKGAILSATKTIARNYAKNNILAYVVTPGIVRTRLSEQAAAAAGGEAAFTASLAMGEWVPPSDIGSLVHVPRERRLPPFERRDARREWRELYPLSAYSAAAGTVRGRLTIVSTT